MIDAKDQTPRPATVLVIGCLGRMGRAVIAALAETSDLVYRYGLDLGASPDAARAEVPVFRRVADVPGDYDVAIEFTGAAATPDLIELLERDRKPLVSASTGRSPEQTAALEAAAAGVPLFRAANFSIGIAMLQDLVARAAERLWPLADIEILEEHHRNKLDAPSGTALAIADRIQAALEVKSADRLPLVQDRSCRHSVRPREEIGMAVRRGGGIAGRHEVLFALPQENLRIEHEALDRSVFADGAVQAARFLVGQPAGFYSMEDLIRG
ncbi:MAG: 4-hydroxy-tetrahydrodipicolinate reductase [Bacillota bacterium]|nr:4-hydroxy-tetrahydrodipicolinate reductase [Bacillota bacterium]